MQKRWKRPQLTVLVRNQPQEQILSACKSTFMLGNISPNAANTQCQYSPGGMACGICETMGNS